MSDHGHYHGDKRRKRKKIAAYIGAFAVFQILVIVVFVLVVMRVRRPRFRVGTLDIQTLVHGNQSAPSFNMSFTAPIRIKNNNFGPYKYEATTVNFTYGGIQIGQAAVPKSKANFLSTKKLDVFVTVDSQAVQSNSATLGEELNNGILTVKSVGTMTGKVEVMLIFKKRKATTMDCTMIISLTTREVQSLTCK